ncbi:2,3-diaminopropionate biosynthesis protein SbnA [Brachybacterium sp. EF45031]|uniref:2,3-diaminopropionate biosynthesis protein SbnA n=1 Tax=Brachybacterium sillae TaxID=2810536 RepID=UPI00217E9C21|nr:2,3-diaminopropionate biosynthesis protein SbnA [Brachybacterium sillae]MCS6711749.1 2,3-diaminopropionate biosynthesis protein SbnA [Brachybacterium sillae]
MSPSSPSRSGARGPSPLDDLAEAVGGTPLVRLRRLFPDLDGDSPRLELYAKLEQLNPGGSTKDRPALAMLEDALASGRLAPGGTVVESSSGNLGMALARACAAHGVRFLCVVDSRINAPTAATIRALGGELEQVTQPDPETGDLLTARVKRVQQLLEEIPGAVNLHQYGNPANPAAHRDGTMREIAEALDHRVDALYAAVSTTGTIGGCAAYVRDHDMTTRLVAVDAEGSVLFGGTAGTRRLPGMGAGFVTDLSRQVQPDEVVRVDELACTAGARLLARREGILAGASTGGIVAALARTLPSLPDGSRVAMIVHDGGSPYLSTVYDDEWVGQQLGADADALDRARQDLLAASRGAEAPGGAA